ncbi:helix-turn-helix domain-containing protein [Stomatohabitans albus]|uniref:helix-turn-helix domain-containing protein n=1 Tax=Stomatohabitans albus TaxID=3110766 RepID=UPI00300CF5D6
MNRALHDRTYFPPTHDEDKHKAQALQQTVDKLEEATSNIGNQTPSLIINDGSGTSIDLPPDVLPVLIQVIEAMSQGLAISLVPHNMVLTTQEAADMLGISRPTLVRMLEDGKIPFERRNRHRRLYLRDVVEYRERQRLVSHDALSDMVSDAESLGLYEIDHDEIIASLDATRTANNKRA